MSTDLPPIPPAVSELAQKNNCENIKKNNFWNGKCGKLDTFKDSEVYDVTIKNSPIFHYILFKDGQARFATQEEIQELSDVFMN